MPRFIVVDSVENTVLFNEKAKDPTDAVRQAKKSDLYGGEATVIVYEAKEPPVLFSPNEQATL